MSFQGFRDIIFNIFTCGVILLLYNRAYTKAIY